MSREGARGLEVLGRELVRLESRDDLRLQCEVAGEALADDHVGNGHGGHGVTPHLTLLFESRRNPFSADVRARRR